MWQAFNELIHSNTYALLVETFITDEKELSDAFDAIEKDEGVKAKADLVIKWVEDASVTPHEKLVAFAFTESVFFSGSFSSIGWIKQYKHVMERALVWSNDKISTDEALHCKNSFTIYNMLRDKLPAWRVYQIGCGKKYVAILFSLYRICRERVSIHRKYVTSRSHRNEFIPFETIHHVCCGCYFEVVRISTNLQSEESFPMDG